MQRTESVTIRFGINMSKRSPQMYLCGGHQTQTTIFSDNNKTLCEPKDFVDLSVNVDDEYFFEPYEENFTPCLPRS